MRDQTPDITDFLRRWGAGETEALAGAVPLIYAQLRALAESQMRRERNDHTLQPTALVNELYLRLASQRGGEWKDREHFFAFAGLLMRRILIDYAKRTRREKRGGRMDRVPLTDDLPWLGNSPEEILALDRALETLELSDPRKARVIELRALLGCTAGEAAGILGISKITADRDWRLAKAWLHRELNGATAKDAQS
jgi:RNA polymerase sigma factor (TIGR02999 family)